MRKWQIGDVKITQLVELTTASLGPYLLPQATPNDLKKIDWMSPFVDSDHRLVLSMHMLVLEINGQTILVDTCIGNDKERTYPKWNMMQTDFLSRFEAAGFNRDTVDTVLCTHMHVDHVGWNTLRVEDNWEPTFSNADYLYSRREWEHWSTQPQEYGPVFEDSVQPIFDSGLAQLVPDDYRVTDEIWLEPTPVSYTHLTLPTICSV